MSDELTRQENDGQVEVSDLGPSKTSRLSDQLAVEENEGSEDEQSVQKSPLLSQMNFASPGYLFTHDRARRIVKPNKNIVM